MGRVFRALGLSVGIVLNNFSGPPNRAAFMADVTYVTSSSLAWLYLSDNTSTQVSQLGQLVS
jgi:preprotein translocase subunit SecA